MMPVVFWLEEIVAFVEELVYTVNKKNLQNLPFQCCTVRCFVFHGICDLKGHGNEADFLGFLQKLGPHRSLTLPFKPFRFWLRICGDIRNRKTTPQLTKSGSRHGESGSRYSNFLKFSIDFPDFIQLNQPFKRSIWQKRSLGCCIAPVVWSFFINYCTAIRDT